jgi:NAD(P)H-quinone oxidoreductase subunit 5
LLYISAIGTFEVDMFDTFSQTIWWVPCYAFIGVLGALFWSPGIVRQIGPRPSGYLNMVMTLLALVHSLLALVAVWGNEPQYLSAEWLHGANLMIPFDIEVSAVNVGALVLITALNLMAQFFAIAYLEMDWGWGRFFSLMALFEGGICTLVLCNSLFFTYVVLEILTLGTYLLIGFWFNQSLVVTGARDAFLTKRVGDLILLMGVVALLPLAGTWNYGELAKWAATAELDPRVSNLLCLALIAGPLAKCAQFPLHLWLDEAMEGPMPATILRNTIVVSTGAWVLIKLYPVLTLSPLALTVMVSIGAVTAVGASLIAIAQVDVKRCLSYSVSAYMGLIFIAVGTGQTQMALTLLFTYAIAMSLLVMSIGGIVLNTITQDVRQYGGLWSRRPISGLAFIVGAAALVAFPPLGGFWVLLEMAEYLAHFSPLLLAVLLLVNGLSALSLTREFCLIFGGKIKPMTLRSPEGLWAMVLPMTVTMGFALHVPLFLQAWHLLPTWTEINGAIALALVGSTLIGAAIAAYCYLNEAIAKPIQLPFPAIQDFFANDLYTAQLYKNTIVGVVGGVSSLINWFDRFIVDGLVNLVGFVTLFGGQTLKYSSSGQGQFYILTIVIGMALIVAFLSYPILVHLPLLTFFPAFCGLG